MNEKIKNMINVLTKVCQILNTIPIVGHGNCGAFFNCITAIELTIKELSDIIQEDSSNEE